MKQKTVRKAKLQSKTYSNIQVLFPGAPKTPERKVPWLNISGRWLEEIGFYVGSTVRITTQDKKLIIEPEEEHLIQSPAH